MKLIVAVAIRSVPSLDFTFNVTRFETIFDGLRVKFLSGLMKLSDIIVLLFLLYPRELIYFMIYACAAPCPDGICTYSDVPPTPGGKSRKNRNRNKNRKHKSKTRKSNH